MKNSLIIVFTAVLAAGTLAAADKVSGRPLSLEDIQALEFKTINGESIVGSGNIEIPGSGDYKSAVNAADFGAVGDGVADDTAAIAAALAEAKKSAKALYLAKTPSGSTYLVSSSITLEDGMSLTSALGVKLIVAEGDALTVKGTKISVSNLTIEAPEGAGIIITQSSDVRLKDVIVNKAKSDGVAIASSSNVCLESIIVKNAAVNAVRLGAKSKGVQIRTSLLALSPTGIYFDGASAGAIIVNNQIDCTKYALSGVAFDPDDPDAGAIIANNTFNVGTVYLTGGRKIKITGNTFLRVKGDTVALQISGSADQPFADSIITDNTIGNFNDKYSNNLGAIVVSGAQRLVIRGNVLTRLTDYYKPITGSGKVDIVVSDSKKVIVSGNSVEGDINISTGNEGVVSDGNVTIAPEPEPEPTPES